MCDTPLLGAIVAILLASIFLKVDVSVNVPGIIFKVKCSLDKSFLELSNGVKGYLKKGMTMQCRFILTRRSLLQLVYERADSWLNPHSTAKAAQ